MWEATFPNPSQLLLRDTLFGGNHFPRMHDMRAWSGICFSTPRGV
jgi:hypothetical protein